MLHTMGPRDHYSTIQAGLERGHRFGFVASTDQHSGYPGSYGEGRLAVLAPELSRGAIWDALHQRRTYAVTGDKIAVDFRVNGERFGGVTRGSSRTVTLRATGSDWWDTIEVVKNGRLLRRWAPLPHYRNFTADETIRAKVRIEWGWFRPAPAVQWQGRADLDSGHLFGLETCFRGEPVVRRDQIQDIAETIPHAVLESGDTHVTWRSETRGNATTRHSTTQAIILDVGMRLSDRLNLTVNGRRISHPMQELLAGTYGHFTTDFPSPAIRIHRAVPATEATFETEFQDDAPERPTDYYYARLRQRNEQCAWITPVWVEA
jgi:hypothetical protein